MSTEIRTADPAAPFPVLTPLPEATATSAEQPYGGPERRADKRSEVVVQARLAMGDTVFEGTIVNLSFGGALFVTAHSAVTVPVDSPITLTLIPLPNSATSELHWDSTVVRCEHPYRGDPNKIAYGIRFDEATPRTGSALRSETQTITCEV